VNFKSFGVATVCAVSACAFTGTAYAGVDTYTSGAAYGRLDTSTGLPSLDPQDVGIIGGGAYTIPTSTPVTGGGSFAMADVANGGLSDIYTNVSIAYNLGNDDNIATITLEFGTVSGNAFSSLWGNTVPVFTNGNEADLLLFDIGNATGTGAPLFPIDGVLIGSEWILSNATQKIYNQTGLIASTPFAPIPGLPNPDPTNFYFASGFDFGTLTSTFMNKAVFSFDLQLVPAPGAMAFLAFGVMSTRRRRS
jgi:hypothetical protein